MEKTGINCLHNAETVDFLSGHDILKVKKVYLAELLAGPVFFVRQNLSIGGKGVRTMDKKGSKTMDKKLNIRVFALAFVLLVLLVGCGGATDKVESAGTQEPTSAAPAPILSELPTSPELPTSAELPISAELPTSPEESVSEDETIHVSKAG